MKTIICGSGDVGYSIADKLSKEKFEVTVVDEPSEKLNKYHWAKALAPDLIIFGGGKSLMHEVTEADLVVGCGSMAMVVALLAGKRVISCIPPGGSPCKLPHDKIECMQDIVERKS